MRTSNIWDKFQIQFRYPADWATVEGYQTITGLTLSNIEMDWGFIQEKGIWPQTEPNSFAFSITKPAVTSGPALDEWLATVDVLGQGSEVCLELDEGYGSFNIFGQPYYVKSIAIEPNVRGSITYTYTCEDAWSRIQQVPLTMSGGTLGSEVTTFDRVDAVLEQCAAYYDGVYGPLYATTAGVQFDVPALDPATYTREPAGNVLNKLLRGNLTCFWGDWNSWNYGVSGGYNYTVPLFESVALENYLEEYYPITKDWLAYAFPSTEAFGSDFQYGFTSNKFFDEDHPEDSIYSWPYSSIEIVDNTDEVIPCIRIEQESNTSNHYSNQNADAIKRYGANYVKESVDLATTSTHAGSDFDSIEYYGKSLYLTPNTQRIKSLTAPMIDQRSNEFKSFLTWSHLTPGMWTPITHNTPELVITEQYMVTKISLRINSDTQEAQIELWKPNLQWPF